MAGICQPRRAINPPNFSLNRQYFGALYSLSNLYIPQCSACVSRLFSSSTIAALTRLALTALLPLLIFAAMLPNLIQKLVRPFSSATMGVAPIGTGIGNLPAKTDKLTIAAGCFWGVEHIYRKNFKDRGLIDARVGYIGGNLSNPGYRAVCSGTTGHAEALQVLYDPSVVSYETLVEFFFRMHDPTTANRQGPDVGSQYRSAIFYHSPEQEVAARKVVDAVQKEWFKERRVVTEVLPAGQWWDAEDYHQLYLDNNPGGYECPSHHVRNFPTLSVLQ